MRGSNLHLIIDLSGPAVERTAEHALGSKHIVDLVRIVAAAARDDLTRALIFSGIDLRLGIRHRKDDRDREPCSFQDALPGEPDRTFGQANKDVGARHHFVDKSPFSPIAMRLGERSAHLACDHVVW